MKSKKLLWQIIVLILISVGIYGAQMIAFHDAKTTFFYIFQDMAFLPVSIIVTILLVGALLEKQSKSERIEKSRILTSSFFSIIGNSMMEHLCNLLDEDLHLRWNQEEMDKILQILDAKTEIVLTIASNPHLLDHEIFTDLLWAVLHLREELYSRIDLEVTEADRQHILMDSKRVFDLYLENWGQYCEYVRKEYPYYYNGMAFDELRRRIEAIEEMKRRKGAICADASK